MKHGFLNMVNYCAIVFDVDIGDGEPTRKLPYNKGGDYINRHVSLFSSSLLFFFFCQIPCQKLLAF